MNKKKTHSVKKQLLLLVVTAVLPLFIFAVMLSRYVAIQQSKALESSVMSTTSAFSSAIDQEIAAIESNLLMLSILEDFDAERMPDLYRRLRRFLLSQEEWSSIALASLNGQIILNTRLDYYAKLPNLADQAFFQEIIREEKPTISGYRMGRLTKKPIFSVAVPVKVGGKTSLIIMGTVSLSAFSEKLKQQKLPPNWTATIVDQNNVIIARSRLPELYIGKKITPQLEQKLLHTKEGTIRGKNMEGQDFFASFKTSNLTKWTVVIGMPAEERNPTQIIFWPLFGGGTLLMLLGVLISLWMSKRISNSLQELSSSAKSLGKRENLPEINTNLTEVREVSEALTNASIEREEYDKMMKDLYLQAQQAIEIRDSFLSVASHELKTPLTTLNLQAEILRRSVRDDFSPEKVETATSRMLSQLKRLTNLIDDLLDITRINAGKLDIRLEEMDFVKIVQDILHNFEIESRGIEVSLQSPGKLVGAFDRNRLEQVFTNLVSNAIKYGAGKPIEVTVFEEGAYAVFQIKDSGLGIEEKNIDKIFERFERIVQNNNIRGLGLGLWIVKRIVEHLSGTISVESAGLGEGSIFTVKIPTNKEKL